MRDLLIRKDGCLILLHGGLCGVRLRLIGMRLLLVRNDGCLVGMGLCLVCMSLLLVCEHVRLISVGHLLAVRRSTLRHGF